MRLLALALIASLWAALICSCCSMPHLHSPVARAKRRDRVVRRGFLRLAPGVGCKFIAVQESVAARVRCMARSTELHADHEKLAGARFHHARLASIVATWALARAFGVPRRGS